MIYSQNNEQDFILAACPGDNGRFLDVGAWSAFDKSNTRALYERGWGGVLVEPSPVPFAGLKAEYGDVDRVTLIQAAVVIDPGLTEIQLYVTADAVSTTEEANYQKWREHAKFDGRIHVPAITLERIFEYYFDAALGSSAEIDFVSLDTEGTSVDLLHRLFALGKRPRCICVEHDERTTEILSVATGIGYACVYASGENLVLVRMVMVR